MSIHGSIGLPPDSTGSRLHTHIHDIEGEDVHNQVFSLGDNTHADHIQSVDEYGAAYVRFAGGGAEFDSFGKMKVSQETTLSAYIPIYNNITQRMSVDTLGAGAIVHSPLESAYRMQVDTGATDSVIATTNKYHKYTPGTTNTILMTVVSGDTGKAGVRRRWGFFDGDDGLFFEMDGTDMGVVVRSSVSGSIVDRKTSRTAFNGDKVDGTGVSGITIDPSKSNIFWIDYQWLGVGAVRFGIVAPDGNKILLHTYENANQFTTVYMRTGSLPIRWEIANTEVTGSASELKMLNATVKVNDVTPNYNGKLKAGSVSAKPVTNEYSVLLSVKPALMYNGKINRTASIPKSMNVYAHTAKPLSLSIVKNAVMTDSGTTWTGGLTGGATEYNSDMTLATPTDYNSLGHLLFTSLVTEGERLCLSQAFSYLDEYLSLHGNGLSGDTYSIIARTIIAAETDDVTVGLHWEEIYM